MDLDGASGSGFFLVLTPVCCARVLLLLLSLYVCVRWGPFVQLQMLGYPVDFASFYILEVMSRTEFAHKRVGYLAAGQVFSPTTDVLLLTTNLFKKVRVACPLLVGRGGRVIFCWSRRHSIGWPMSYGVVSCRYVMALGVRPDMYFTFWGLTGVC